jgi:hypothetical protein
VFIVTEVIKSPYLGRAPELKFVKEIGGNNETPSKDDILVIGDVSFVVTSIERNYDHHAIVVYVSRLGER